MFWTPEKHYLSDPFDTESELESAIREVSEVLFRQSNLA
jgi:hypothetical protein